jgi:hypothetical protein
MRVRRGVGSSFVVAERVVGMGEGAEGVVEVDRVFVCVARRTMARTK